MKLFPHSLHFGFAVTFCLSAWSQHSAAEDIQWDFSGHNKYRWDHNAFAVNSINQVLFNDNSDDLTGEVRLKLDAKKGSWKFDLDYQLIAFTGDTQKKRHSNNGYPLTPLPNDDDRLWDLTHIVSDKADYALVHRLDRFNITYAGEDSVVRFGRQAISWGNGLFFSPLDIFNPFDPTLVDQEYKSGDDMLYGQHLLSNGDDIQGVWVIRRDPTDHHVDSELASLAIKYHGWLGESEYDVLVANHYDDWILGVGLVHNLGEGVWRSDLTITESDTNTVPSFSTNYSYGWVWRDTNFNGSIEYFYNGFGKTGDYTLADVQRDIPLQRRLSHGELFTTGRHYLGASADIELSPLLVFTPNLFVNLSDQSTLLQLAFRFDWMEDLQILSAVNVPLGSDGTEYGGQRVNDFRPYQYNSTEFSLFTQLAWYF